MKKILLGILLVIFAISCGSKPEEVVSKFIDNIKEKKIEEAGKYTTNSSALGNIGVEYNNKVQEALFESLFVNMKYEIVKTEKKDKDTTVVTVNVENVDTFKMFLVMFNKMINETLPNVSMDEEFNKILSSKEIPLSKNTTDFIVVKTKKGNKIELTPDNIDVLFGKINTTLSTGLEKLGTHEETQNSGVNNNSTTTTTPTTPEVQQDGPSIGKDQKLPEPLKK